MSNHFSAAMLKFPGGDARLDLTDLFVFESPDSPGRTVLIVDVNPFMTGADFTLRRSTASTSTTTETRRPTLRSHSCSPSRTAEARPGR
jgi:hypothetical protein